MNIQKIILLLEVEGFYCDEKGNIYDNNSIKVITTYSGKFLYFTIPSKIFKKLNTNIKTKKVAVHYFIAYKKYNNDVFLDNTNIRHIDGNKLNNNWNNIILSKFRSFDLLKIKDLEEHALINNLDIKILDYIKRGKKLCLKISNKYGIVIVGLNEFKNKNATGSVQSAINPTEYWINIAKEKYGDKYDYSLVDYVNDRVKINIICKEHGSFPITPNNFLRDRNCPICGQYNRNHKKCGTSFGYNLWLKQAANSKNFDSFKIYILKCWNENETFYKIGRSFKTIELRFKNINYNYEIIANHIIKNGLTCCKLENDLHKKNINFHYLPKLEFDGFSECYSNIDLVNIENYIKNYETFT